MRPLPVVLLVYDLLMAFLLYQLRLFELAEVVLAIAAGLSAASFLPGIYRWLRDRGWEDDE